MSILDAPVLVLNKNWQPVNVSPVSRALTMMFNEVARAVDPVDYQQYDWDLWSKLDVPEGERFIRTQRRNIRAPEVVTLLTYGELPTSSVTFSRRNIFKRDHYTCMYCGCQPGSEDLTIDHIVPRSQGGDSQWDNCVLACLKCNHKKADRTPEQAKMKLRKTPHQPEWNPLYAAHDFRRDSWSKFVSEAYWNALLER